MNPLVLINFIVTIKLVENEVTLTNYGENHRRLLVTKNFLVDLFLKKLITIIDKLSYFSLRQNSLFEFSNIRVVQLISGLHTSLNALKNIISYLFSKLFYLINYLLQLLFVSTIKVFEDIC
jgi:hypothetical protein